MIGRRLNILTAAFLAGTVFLSGCAADRLHHDGLKAVEKGEYEDGVARLQKAVEKEPDNLAFRLDLSVEKGDHILDVLSHLDIPPEDSEQ